MIEWLRKYSKWATLFIFGVALIAVYKTFDNFSFIGSMLTGIFDAIKPFIIAFIIAYLLNIPAKKISYLVEKKIKSDFIRRHSSGIGITVVYVLFAVAVALTLSSLLPAIYRNFMEMYNNIPQFVDTLVDFVNKLEVSDSISLQLNSADIYTKVSEILNLFDVDAISMYAQGVMTFTSGLLDVVIAIIASVYMLLDKERINRGIKHVVRLFSKNGRGEAFLSTCSRVNSIFTNYVYSRLMCCIIMAILCSIILALMNEKYALILGIFIGFMDMIPYFGSIISWCVCAIVMAISGGVFHSFWCSLVMLIMQQIDGNILGPKIMGSKLDIRPLTIIAAVSIGGTLFGFAGMLFSVPIVAIIRLFVYEYIAAKDKERAEEIKDSDEGENEV